MTRPSEYPKLLVFKEKHSDSYYLINSAEDLHHVATAIVRERAALGYYYETDVEKLTAERESEIDRLIERAGLSSETAPRTVEDIQKILALTDDEHRAAKLLGVELDSFAAYPASLKAKALDDAKAYIRSVGRVLSDYGQQIEDALNILRIVHSERAEEIWIEHRNRRYNLALWILDGRRDYEYEGYDFEDLQPVPSTEELENSRKK